METELRKVERISGALESEIQRRVNAELESQFNAFFERVMNDPLIPASIKERILQHAIAIGDGQGA